MSISNSKTFSESISQASGYTICIYKIISIKKKELEFYTVKINRID